LLHHSKVQKDSQEEIPQTEGTSFLFVEYCSYASSPRPLWHSPAPGAVPLVVMVEFATQ